MRKRPLFLFACVFLTGLACKRYDAFMLCFFIAGVLGVEVFYGMKHKNRKRMAGRSVLLLSAFLIGMVHMHREENFRNAYMSKIIDDTTGVVFGEISKIEHTDYGVRMILSDCYIRLEEETVPCNDVMVYASVSHFQVGEIHKITGQLNTFETARNQGNFDARTFYQSQKIDFSIWCEENVCLDSGDVGKEGDFSLRTMEYRIKNALLLLRDNLETVFVNSMESKAAGFFIGMILGDKTNLDERLKELFTLGGISHILAISGLHVSIIGRGLYNQLRKRGFGFGLSGIFAGVLLVAYCYMVGHGMSAVRAVGMMLISFVGQYLGRSYDMLNALGAMVLLLLWENPFLLEYSGFWFSIMALIGVGFVGKALSEQVEDEKNDKKNKIMTLWGSLTKSLWMCTGITITTLPIVSMCYYEVPLYSSFVNFIVLPILTPVFCLALAAGLVGIWFPNLAAIVLLPCGWVLGFYEWFCEFIESLPFSSIITGAPSMQVVVVYYVVLFVGIFFMQRKGTENSMKKEAKNERKQCMPWIKKYGRSLVLCIICFALVIYPKPKPFEITFLDVGQGDGIYISAGDGSTYFIDGGSTSEDMVGEYRILPFLKSKGVQRIDYWFVSHADMDHISGVFEVLESGYKIGNLVISKYAPEDENLLALISKAESCGVRIIRMDAEECVVSRNLTFTCLYPWDLSLQDKNEASLVLEVEIEDGRKAFFAGDISTEVEQLLLKREVVNDIWLYKASHHGSKYSNSSELLRRLQPEITAISCSKNNHYGHPHAETIERIVAVESEVFYTMKDGQITIDDSLLKE